MAREGLVISREDRIKAEVAQMNVAERKALGNFIHYLNLREAQTNRPTRRGRKKVETALVSAQTLHKL